MKGTRGLFNDLPEAERKPTGEFPIPIRRHLRDANGMHPDTGEPVPEVKVSEKVDPSPSPKI